MTNWTIENNRGLVRTCELLGVPYWPLKTTVCLVNIQNKPSQHPTT